MQRQGDRHNARLAVAASNIFCEHNFKHGPLFGHRGLFLCFQNGTHAEKQRVKDVWETESICVVGVAAWNKTEVQCIDCSRAVSCNMNFSDYKSHRSI